MKTIGSTRGATVVACGIRPGADTEPDLPNVHYLDLDVTDEHAVIDAVGQVAATHSGLDVLVTAAGIQRYGTAADTTADEWHSVLAVNLTGAFFAVKAALPHLRRRPSASIVLVSSVQAFVTQTAVAAYTTSKGALNAFRVRSPSTRRSTVCAAIPFALRRSTPRCCASPRVPSPTAARRRSRT